MRLGTWLLVKLSDMCAAFSPANMSRYKDESSYSEWQYRNARWTYENLFAHFGPFEGKVVADLACGDGGKTSFYAGLQPKIIVGVDMEAVKIHRGKTYHDGNNPDEGALHFVAGDVEGSPLRSDSFDLCLSEDGFEHFPCPPAVLEEANRILKPGGRLLILFEPYYRAGGPHLYNWIRLPWAHLPFSDETMIEATRVIAKRASAVAVESRETQLEQVEREIYMFKHFINKITLRRFKQYLLASEGWRLVCFHTFCTNDLFRPFLGIPILAELCVSVLCVLEKQPGGSIRRADFRASDNRLTKMISIKKLGSE